jgi:hypothetical protein
VETKACSTLEGKFAKEQRKKRRKQKYKNKRFENLIFPIVKFKWGGYKLQHKRSDILA